MKNIFLIGMMGAGKSTVGKLISQNINVPFIDVDCEIEEIMEMPIEEIFKNYGEKRFRLIEKSFFRECTKNNQFIYSTGGGIILNSKNQKILKNLGKCFFLDCSTETIITRLKTKNRPLINNENDIKTIYKKRYNLYQACAHHTIDANIAVPQLIAKKIIQLINN